MMQYPLVTRPVLRDLLDRLGRSFGGSGRLYLLGETTQLFEGWRTWTNAVHFHASVSDEAAWQRVVRARASSFQIDQEFPGDLIPLPDGWAERSRPAFTSAGLEILHFDPYSVTFRHIARGDEPDYHIALTYMKHEWVDVDVMNQLLQDLLPRFSMGTIQQDPAEFRRKYKGLIQMAARLAPGTVHRPF